MTLRLVLGLVSSLFFVVDSLFLYPFVLQSVGWFLFLFRTLVCLRFVCSGVAWFFVVAGRSSAGLVAENCRCNFLLRLQSSMNSKSNCTDFHRF